MIEKYLAQLNAEQEKPVRDTEGAVLVIAGAGSGKTRVLTTRIAYIVQELNVSPERVLAITFTNKAANEMKERLEKMEIDTDGMWVCTIHSMCVRILRREASVLGFDSNFSIYSEQDRERVIKRILKDAEVSEESREKMLKSVKFHIAEAKTKGYTPREYAETHADEDKIGEICRYYALYEDELKKSNAMDFDDLLIHTERLLATSEETRKKYANRFLYVHVDEFQDTNAVQYRIVKHLVSVHGNLFAVGDDDQSIYGWRGAEIKNILGFPKDFPGAKVYKLERNYRSTAKILKVANCVIAENSQRNQKELWTDKDRGSEVMVQVSRDENAEARFIAANIRRALDNGESPADFAVLMRVNALSRTVEQAFVDYDIPYRVYGGFKFFERKEIKDLSAYLRILNNPLDNEAVLRVLNVPKRGIGDTTADKLLAYANSYGLSVFDAVMEADATGINAGAVKKVADFGRLIRSLMIKMHTLSLSELVKAVITDTQFLSQFMEKTEEDENKKENVYGFLGAVQEFEKANPGATLADYLNSITLSADTDEMGLTESVSLATVHAVKGLEFTTVFLIGLEESLFPVSRASDSREELEEERRLMYVAVTRAKENLCLCSSETRFLHGARNGYSRSRFLKECIPALAEREARKLAGQTYSAYSAYNEKRSSPYQNSYAKAGNLQRVTLPEKKEQAEFDPSSYFGAKKAVAQTAKKTGFVTGSKVAHPRFGEGTVIEVKDGPNGGTVTVAFPGAGIKTLAVAIAPLKQL